MPLKFLVCAAALSILSVQMAEASLVQVVRPSPSGWGWIAVAGDLETPQELMDPLLRKQESMSEGLFYIPFSSNGFAVGRWEKENFGPIFADVLFSKPHAMDLLPSYYPPASISIPDPSVTDAPGSGDVLGGSSNPFQFQPGGFFSGSLSGTVPASFSGEITGTTGGSVDIVLSGQVSPVSSVPLPGAAWLFVTGLTGWFGFLHHRSLSRMLVRLRGVTKTGRMRSK
ncbi:MAG TPA: hypothetical protein VLY20_06095 [Nitrospiria bacterium]|nr:hypothetical protein [Nitrospiria bacterium]